MTKENQMLTKAESVVHLVEQPADEDVAVVFTSSGEYTEYPYVFVDVDRWRDMGAPTVVTVTVEPGDRLNDEP